MGVKGRSRRRVGRVIPVGILLLVLLPLWPAWWTVLSDRDSRVALAAGQRDDASRLNRTSVQVLVPEGDMDTIIATVRSALANARLQEHRGGGGGG